MSCRFMLDLTILSAVPALEIKEWGGFQDTVYLQYHNIMKIHAGSDDKLWIQFALPYM